MAVLRLPAHMRKPDGRKIGPVDRFTVNDDVVRHAQIHIMLLALEREGHKNMIARINQVLKCRVLSAFESAILIEEKEWRMKALANIRNNLNSHRAHITAQYAKITEKVIDYNAYETIRHPPVPVVEAHPFKVVKQKGHLKLVG